MINPLSKAVGVSLLLVSLPTCDQAPQAAKPLPTTEYQRFVPVIPDTSRGGIPWHGLFALDTKTGQLCKATGWTAQPGNAADADFLSTINALPLCKDLARAVPPKEPSIWDKN